MSRIKSFSSALSKNIEQYQIVMQLLQLDKGVSGMATAVFPLVVIGKKMPVTGGIPVGINQANKQRKALEALRRNNVGLTATSGHVSQPDAPTPFSKK